MAKELAFVLINPYTIAKSRTGGVIARYIGRTDLTLVAARMFGPCEELVRDYAAMIRVADKEHMHTCNMIADYILESYGPNRVTGKARRVMLLLFEGEDAINTIWNVTGSSTLKYGSGQTIRDTYGDYVLGPNNEVQYFEPAVLVAPTKLRAETTLRMWANYSASHGGIIDQATDVPEGQDVERTLVMLKPDNFRYPSLRPGNIIDVLSMSGLRIVGVKKFSMTVAQAEAFYGPVKKTLKAKFSGFGAKRAADALSREFGFKVEADSLGDVCCLLSDSFAESQFEKIVNFMTGFKPSECTEEAKGKLGSEGCLALIYDGVEAVETIRTILGPTDPRLAKPGSVRREFGHDILVNAAHASDSAESAVREMDIVRVDEDTIVPLVEQYYGRE